MARTPDGTVNIRWAWAAIDAVMTSAGHQPRCPDMTAQAAASAAMKNTIPNQGFQLGVTAMPGIHSVRPTMSPLAHSPPAAPSTDQAASTASEQATRQKRAAPHSTPCAVSRWTGTASSQYWSGPGSNTPWASRVAWPTIGLCAVSEFHDRSAMAASSPTGRQPPAMRRAGPSTKGSHAARCATARSAVSRPGRRNAVSRPGRRSAIARRILSRAFFGSGPFRQKRRNHGGRGHISVLTTFARTEAVLIRVIPAMARFLTMKNNKKINARQ